MLDGALHPCEKFVSLVEIRSWQPMYLPSFLPSWESEGTDDFCKCIVYVMVYFCNTAWAYKACYFENTLLCRSKVCPAGLTHTTLQVWCRMASAFQVSDQNLSLHNYTTKFGELSDLETLVHTSRESCNFKLRNMSFQIILFRKTRGIYNKHELNPDKTLRTKIFMCS